MSQKIYEMVTQRILEGIEQTGILPWKKPWSVKDHQPALPTNLVSKRRYQGINTLLLASMPYENTFWLSYKQCVELGGQVRKGEKGTPVVFWKIMKEETIEGDKKSKNSWPLLRYSTVFNAEQCDGLKLPETIDNRPPTAGLKRCFEVANDYMDRPRVQSIHPRASYSTLTDIINMPSTSSFECREEYFSTLFHEMAHSTGHPSRLNRKGIISAAETVLERYGKEELIAEMAASFLCAEAGISPVTLDNSVAYLKGWIETIKGDPRMLIEAASQAQKACDWILKRSENQELSEAA